ncbi:MAG: thioredoxin domain-containing protein [bacterium]
MSENQEKKSGCECGSSSKLMLLVGLLLGIAIISTIAFFVLLYRGSGENKTGAVEGVDIKKEDQVGVKNDQQNQQAEKPEDAANDQQAQQQQVDLSKLELNSGDHIKGDANAPVTVVVYDDFECPFCGAFEGTNQQVIDYLVSKYPTWTPVMPNLIKDYVDTGKVKFVYRHFPLPASMHPNAFPAAEASECAGVQGKFWEMHDKIFVMNGSESVNVESFKQAARDLGLDMDKYNSCMDNHEMKAKVDADKASGEAVGVNGTPGAFINGTGSSGAVSYDEFKKLVDEKLGTN